MTLYRTYRPQNFASIIGQDHIKRTLLNAIAHQLTAHAYLFSGPRGSGKTSIARILAMAVNCLERGKGDHPINEPCGACLNCEAIRAGRSLAVIEIDAASNRGIDEIRALRETISLAPCAGVAKKVYIIDEVHMLTKEAFNALLKTLEEPPSHALFILATTELHKVPETIISRVQHFEFKRATPADIRDHLTWVAKEEKLAIEPAAIELIASHADGAFRDALSLLGQLQALGEQPITADTVRTTLGVAPETELAALVAASLVGEAEAIHASISQFAEHGYDPSSVIDGLILVLRSLLWDHYGIAQTLPKQLTEAKYPPAKIVERIEALLTAKQQLRWSPLPFLPIELALIPITVNSSLQTSTVATPVSQPVVVPPVAVVQPVPTPPVQLEPNTVPVVVAKPELDVLVAEPPVPAFTSTDPLDLQDVWKKVVVAMQNKNASLAALLRASTLVSVTETTTTIGVPFNFYADRIIDHKNAKPLGEILTSLGVNGVIRCQLSTQTSVPPPEPVPATSPTARSAGEVEQDVRDVFGVVETNTAAGA